MLAGSARVITAPGLNGEVSGQKRQLSGSQTARVRRSVAFGHGMVTASFPFASSFLIPSFSVQYDGRRLAPAIGWMAFCVCTCTCLESTVLRHATREWRKGTVPP
jgi:hypothetical protein